MNQASETTIQSYTDWHSSLLRQREEARRDGDSGAVTEITAQIAKVEAKLNALTGNA